MSDAPRHPDYERVKVRLLKAYDEASQPQWLNALASEAIAMGARVPDSREVLYRKIESEIRRRDERIRDGNMVVNADEVARQLTDYILDHAPKGV